MKKALAALALVVAVGLAAPSRASAHVSVAIGLPGFSIFAGVPVAPPVYVAPVAPVYVAPPPVYPVYPVVGGYYYRAPYWGPYRARAYYRGWHRW